MELSFGFLTATASIRTFGMDRVVYLREESSGKGLDEPEERV